MTDRTQASGMIIKLLVSWSGNTSRDWDDVEGYQQADAEKVHDLELKACLFKYPAYGRLRPFATVIPQPIRHKTEPYPYLIFSSQRAYGMVAVADIR